MTDLLTILAIFAVGILSGILAREAHRRWGWPGVAAIAAPVVGLALSLLGRRRPPPPPSSRAPLQAEALREQAHQEAAHLDAEAETRREQVAPMTEAATAAEVELVAAETDEERDAWLRKHAEDVRAGRVW